MKNYGISPEANDVPLDGVDQDCDGLESCFVDNDNDGYGNQKLHIFHFFGLFW